MTHEHNHRDPECLDVFARLSEYIDGELGPAECLEIEEHIADCAPCVDFLRSLRESVELSKSFQGGEAPLPVPPAVEERLKSAWQAALARRH
jgi:anti-sigma factor RsiW